MAFGIEINYTPWYDEGIEFDLKRFTREIGRTMRKDVIPLVVGYCQQCVEGWQIPVDFIWEYQVGTDLLGVRVLPTGPGARFWNYVSRGVKARWISVRKKHTFRRYKKYKPALSLQRYSSYTAPGGNWGGPGVRYGLVGYRYQVYWPGIDPRLFEEWVVDNAAPEVWSVMKDGVVRAIAIAQEKGIRKFFGALKRLFRR